MNLQALRIEAGWLVEYNQLYEADPIEGNEDYFEGSSLLMVKNTARLKLIDVQWRPERDLNGSYQVQVLNFQENFNSHKNAFDIDPNWEEPYLYFTTKSRLELVSKLEELMRTLPVHADPRILDKRGIVSEPSETYRLELLNKGISEQLVQVILEEGNSQVQLLLLDDKSLSKETLKEFSTHGRNKKVRNKAIQRLTQF